MYPKVYIPILWLLSHVVLPVFIVVSSLFLLIITSILYEFLRVYVIINF